jgi:hypothetical protein
MAVPTVPDFAASQVVDDGDLDDLGECIDFVMDPPRCFAYKSSDGALANNTWDEVNFGAEAYDSHGSHDNSTNNSRVAAPEDGAYAVKVSVEFEAHATGSRRIQVRKNAAGNQASGTLIKSKTVNAVAGAGNETTLDADFDVQLVAGDYLEVFVHQTSGGALNVLGTISGTYLSIRWVARTVS